MYQKKTSNPGKQTNNDHPSTLQRLQRRSQT